MTARDDAPLSAASLATRLLPGVALTPGQLAQLRALDVRCQTELFALRERARGEGREWAGPSPTERVTLQTMLVEGVRDLLDDDQRAALDRRLGDDEPR